jgi:prepilin-type N-terminal cleavage/methylation domain-containing protein
MMKTMNTLDRLRAQRETEQGFTLIELLIVMSVMLILMTLAVPQLLKLRKQANETSAIQSLRTIGQAELQYNSAFPANGFSCSLPTLGGDPKSGAPTSQAAQLITPDLSTGQKAGYTAASAQTRTIPSVMTRRVAPTAHSRFSNAGESSPVRFNLLFVYRVRTRQRRSCA